DHLLEMRKALAIDRERTVLFLVIDVEINHVRGNVSFTELAGDLAHARFRIVAIAALLVAERKQRRQGRTPYQRSEIAHYALGIGTVKEVVIQLATLRAEGICVPKLLAEIEAAAIGVVQKNAVRRALPHAQKEGDRFVNGIGRLLVSNVGVPHAERQVATIERPGFVSQA